MPADILQSAIDGDREAMNQLLEKHRDLAFSIALKYLRNADDAEDIVQEAFVKIFLNIRKFRNESAFSTWLYKIVYYEACRHIGKQRRILSIKEEVKDETAVHEDVVLFKDERTNIIRHSMQCLSANEYLVMNLFYLLEKSITEIQQITGQSGANIKVLLHRGRKKIAAYLNNSAATGEI
ncbi:RNA polymerase sigma factor [Chitinophaga vietnamensis]|uniref:RNA polymerase sigma factor n=1 Tax=Chitinophaga vietnamensis TaxID=2593957 RepID=UPI0011781E0D|nr:RNA polymerase sigma factor [Chitinophaga vietnamensis]